MKKAWAKKSDRLHEAVAEFLRANDWIPVMSGPIQISPGERRFTFRLVVHFAGRKKPTPGGRGAA